AFVAPSGAHLLVKNRAPLSAEFASAIGGALDALLGHVRVQLEREPLYRRGGSQPELVEGALEPALADIAPRTDHVREYCNRERHDEILPTPARTASECGHARAHVSRNPTRNQAFAPGNHAGPYDECGPPALGAGHAPRDRGP